MNSLLLIYIAPLLIVIGFYMLLRGRKEKVARAVLTETSEAGLTEPSSLHPKIDPTMCIGCAACVKACPEGDIIGLIRGKAVLIEPTHCIGHGACAQACPAEAIELVFGTERRGVDIPFVGEDFQTNVPGIYIAGELGGMGLIRNAIEQGKQAMEAIAHSITKDSALKLDVVIVGAGPAGLSATLEAKHRGLKYLTIEQEELGGTVAHYPRGKLVMTKPVELPLVGKVKLKDPSKEKLLAFWKEIVDKTKITIHYEERLLKVAKVDNGFYLKTTKGEYQTNKLLLAIGRRGTPRKLGVEGEDLPKVVYKMIDPEQYIGRQVTVVGGGDSALEAAAEIAEQEGARVILSYRSEAFTRARQRNRERISRLAETGKLTLLMPSTVEKISPDSIEINYKDEILCVENDDVIICAGGILPTAFLQSIGIKVETKHGSA
ncbi:MAG: NAD(P)-binding domain-containing protein [bacterium]